MVLGELLTSDSITSFSRTLTSFQLLISFDSTNLLYFGGKYYFIFVFDSRYKSMQQINQIERVSPFLLKL